MNIKITKYISKYKFIITLIPFCACIDPYPIETFDGLRILTVDGVISTNDGPHVIQLSYANQYSNRIDGNKIVATNARVSIINDLGVEIELKEEVLTDKWFCRPGWSLLSMVVQGGVNIPTGRYFTPTNFTVDIGRSYQLKIVLPDGEEYLSEMETVLPIVEIESVHFRPISSGTTNSLIDTKGVELIVDLIDCVNEENFYLWKFTNSYIELNTEPGLARGGANNLRNQEICYIPDLEISKLFHSTSDNAFNGLATRIQIGRIIDDGIRFKSRYRVQVDQYNISSQANDFFRAVRQQLDIQGSVFDPPPANIRGNIRNVSNPNRQVLGYFLAASVASKMQYINRADIPSNYRAVRAMIPWDCRDYCGRLIEPPSSTPPPDWEYN